LHNFFLAQFFQLNLSKTTRMKILISLIFSLIFAQYVSAQTEWAKEVLGFSSEKKDVNLPGQYAAKQALGKPSIMPPQFNTPCSWAPAVEDNSEKEWIHLGFKPLKVQQISIVESFNTGSVSKIWLYDTNQKEYLVYSNDAPSLISMEARVWNYPITLTPYLVASIKIELNTGAVVGENQIDAVALSSGAMPIDVTINTSPDFITANKPENLGETVNSITDELCPVISPDGKNLYFIRQGHPGNMGDVSYQDTWHSKFDETGYIQDAINIGAPINNTDNNGLLSITPDGQKALLLNAYLADGTMGKGVSMSEKINGEWSYPTPLIIEDYYNDNIYGEYFLVNSGNVLLMTVQRKEGEGSKDLHVSFIQGDNSWSKPLNMGLDLNTANSETSPFLAADGITLYFSSKGRPGYGGTDMFVTKRLDDTWTKWSEPQNLGPSLNTASFDAYYSIPASGEYAYYVSYQNSIGAADIFRTKLPEALRPNPVALIKGRVLDGETRLPLSAKIDYENLTKNKNEGSAKSDGRNGEYSIILPTGSNYGFLGIADGYFSVSENLDLSSLKEYKEITRDIILFPIKKGQTIRLNNIFFETGKYVLRNESKSELNRLLKLMKENPTMKIEIQGHTDDVGADVDNLALSKNRSKAVYDYLIKNGILSTRLMTKGFGEAKPIISNTTPENRQLNRRVDFIITDL
jgi:outer membrane protein OmpA-like peptidoglycan-associated protein